AFATANGAVDYSRFDLNGDGSTGGAGKDRFDLDMDGAYGTASATIEGVPVSYDETGVTDDDVLCYYAYSSLYRGDPAARTSAVGTRCRPHGGTIGYSISGSDFDSSFTDVLSVTLRARLRPDGTVEVFGVSGSETFSSTDLNTASG